MDVPYCEEMKILGILITNTIQASARSWICYQHGFEHWHRTLHLDHRIQHAHEYVGESVVYDPSPPAPGQQQPEANKYDNIMVPMERRDISSPTI